MRRVLSAYDSIIKTLGHHQALDYRIAVRLFNEKPALSVTQADDLLATTQKALCDNTEVYKAYLTYHAQINNPARLIEKYNQYKDAEPLSSATTSDIHAILIHALHDTGDMKEMVKVAGVLRDRNRLAMTTEECASMLMYLARNDIKECENWWMYFSGTEITLPPSVYNALVDAFAGAHKGVALHVLGHMQSKGVSPSEETFSYLLRMVDTDKNIRTFDRLLNKTLTKDACSALLTQCVRTGHLARANELRNFLLHRRGDFTFSITSLNCLLAAYARQGSITKGAALLKEMPERDSVTFEIAAHMYARAGDTRGCRDVVAEMHSQGLPFTAGVLLALMDLCVLHGDVEGCEKMFELMGKNGELTSVAFDKMITLYSNSGDLQKAREMWEKMEAQEVEPSTTTYNLIIQAHAKQGRSDECANFLEKMKARQLAPNLGTFAGILAANLQNRNLQGSRKYFEEMVKVIPVTSSAINAMLQYCSWKSSLKGEGFITKK